jgi:hypothetical protein
LGHLRVGRCDIGAVEFQSPVPLMLTGSPPSVPAGGTVTATWSGIATPTPMDWLGLYGVDYPDTNPLDWLYVSCSKTPGNARAAGSCTIPVDVGVSPGTYHLRLFANDGYTLLATSASLTVTAPAEAVIVSGPVAMGAR